MKIWIKSEKSKNDWFQGGTNISYKKNFLIRKGKKKYSTLSFKYNFTDDNDTVYFSYSLPYTYSRL